MHDNYKFGFLGATTFGGSECYNFVLFNYRVKLYSYNLIKQFIKMLNHYKT